MTWCVLRYIYPRGTIRDRCMNIPKVNKLEGFILVGEGNKSLQRKGVEVPVYYFFCGDFIGVDFFGVMFMWWRRVLISVLF